MNPQPTNEIQGYILKRFTILKKLGSGAYGHVWKVQEKATHKVYALKKIFDAFQHDTDAQRTYRQVQILKQLEHPNIIKLVSTIRAYNNKDVYLIFDYMEADLHNVISQGILKDIHIRFIVYQMAKALKYLHSGQIIHRDLKPSNILVNSNCLIKLCDFGLVRSLKKRELGVVLTQGVATRWYRSPEVLLGSKSYSTPADIWSFACIIYQILTGKPLFAGSSTRDQLQKICSFTGYPSDEDINSLQSQISKSLINEVKIPMNSRPLNYLKDLDSVYIDLLTRMLTFNPKKRITVDQILRHQIVKQFWKPQQELVCLKQIITSLDDNKKVSVDEYRRMIYGVNTLQPKPKVLSSSLGAGSVSPKYVVAPTHSTQKMTVTYATKVDGKIDFSKKQVLQKNWKPNTQNVVQDNSNKAIVKNVRSATNMPKNGGFPMPSKKQIDVPNAQQIDKKQTHYTEPAVNPVPYTKYTPVFQHFNPQSPKFNQSQAMNYNISSHQVSHVINQPPQGIQTQNVAWKFAKQSQFVGNPGPVYVPDAKGQGQGLQFRAQKYPGLAKQSFLEVHNRPNSSISFVEAPKNHL